MIYTSKMQRAIKFAIKTHDLYQKQTRKGKGTAYITHPLTVGFILACANAPEDVIVAGILHDTIEDSIESKKVSYEMLHERFGESVADMVQSVSETSKGLSWEKRKEEALRHIENFSHESFLVKSADIISNTSELIDDHARYGDEVFSRFNAPKEKFLDNYIKVIETIVAKWDENPLREDLSNVGKKLENLK
ncbi:MAG TPA: phosphohydrolase [Candidatus Moranbacteria bacterium]|nr:phosphohydrolase [Candidatus Moranbacteria bacterium]